MSAPPSAKIVREIELKTKSGDQVLWPLKLSLLDFVENFGYVRIIYFYQADLMADKDYDSFVERLTHALEVLLERLPALTGKLTILDDGTMEVTKPDEGTAEAKLIVQDFFEMSIDGLKKARFRNEVITTSLTMPSFFAQPTDPTFRVHATRLTDGLAIGLSIKHALVDGSGTFEIAKALGDLTRGSTPAIWPFDDRTLIAPTGTDHVEHKEYIIKPPFVMPPPDPSKPAPVMPPFSIHYVSVSKEALGRLLADAKVTAKSERLSYNDAFSALIWRGFTRARAVPADKIIKVGYAVDGRFRVDPPVPKGYIGNVNYFGLAVTDHLLEKTLGEAADLVREATDSMTPAYLQSAINFIHATPDKKMIQPGFSAFFGSDTVLTNWSRFPLYEADFGFGAPLRVRVPQLDMADGFVVVFPPSPYEEGEAFECVVTLQTQHYDILKNDEEVIKYIDLP